MITVLVVWYFLSDCFTASCDCLRYNLCFLPKFVPRVISESPVSPGTVMFSNGVPYTYQNGMAVFASPETGYAVPQAQVKLHTHTLVIKKMHAVFDYNLEWKAQKACLGTYTFEK